MASTKWTQAQEDNLQEELEHRATDDLAVDISEDNENVYVVMHIPAVDKDKLDVKIKGRELTVSGFRTDKEAFRNHHYVYREIRRGYFTRVIDLPCDVVGEKMYLQTDEGELTVVLPKKVK